MIWYKTVADMMDTIRLVPRILVVMYGYTCYETFLWFTALEVPTNAQAAFASAILAASAGWFNFYVKTGNKE